jgi:hypothetical protein
MNGTAIETGPVQRPATEVVEYPARESRREFLRGTGAVVASAGFAGTLGLPSPAVAGVTKPLPGLPRRVQAYEIRHRAAHIQFSNRVPPQPHNGDEQRYGDKRASFFKGLPQNARGEVDPVAFAALVRAMATGVPAEIEAIPLSPLAARKLANPQGAFAFDMTGVDSHATAMPLPPAFAGAQAAAEVGEIYWMALLRDIPYRDYPVNALVGAALADLNAFSAPPGPKVGGLITSDTLFRGATPGDLIGPYLSQFLWLDVPYGPSIIKQQYFATIPGESFLTEYAEWLAGQQGATPTRTATMDTMPRYIHNMRVLAAYVQKDASFQAFLNAALIVTRFGPRALDPANPYLASRNQAGFVTFGDVHVLDLVTKAAKVALEAAWFQKWLVHRRLRPEAFGGRIELQRIGIKNYDVHPDIMESDAVALIVDKYGTALLPQVYPDGSPLHPAYPSGHAAIGGACITVLKAFFNEDFVLPTPVEASADGLRLDPWSGLPLTLGNELNKLANNISVGRCACGIHYRSDSNGIALGEAVAIGILQDYSLTYNEVFAGFALTKVDGQRIRIANGNVLPA